MARILELDEFGNVVRSNVILYRDVVNDAVVGAWKADWRDDDEPDIRDHTIEGLREWMRERGGYELSKLASVAPFDEHLWNYGMRQQFWVPLAREMDEFADKGRMMVTCLDATGRDWLEEGKQYFMTGRMDDMVTILVSGEERECLAERFKID